MPVGLVQYRAGQIPAAGAGAGSWSQTKLGAGGQLSAIDIAADGTMVVRADTLGCYWYDASAVNPGNAGGTGCWKQMVTDQTLPAAAVGEIYRHASGGGWEIRIAPSNTNRFYMVHGGDSRIYRTDNRGVGYSSWVRCGQLPGGPFYASCNDQTAKFTCYKMAIDPSNADKVFVSTPLNGVFVTTNAGVSWTAVAGLPFGMPYPNHIIGTSTTSNNISTGTHTFTLTSGTWYWYTGGPFLAYQTSNPTNQLSCVITNGSVSGPTTTVNVPNNGTRGSGSGITDWTLGYTPNNGENGGNEIVFANNSSVLYAATYGIGVHKSTDGGSNWTLLNAANMPVNCGKLRVDSAGVPYVANWDNSTLWKYTGSAWVNVYTGLNGSAGGFLAINPANPAQIFTGVSNQWWYNNGTTWSLIMQGAGPRTATDIPYLATIAPFNFGSAVWGADNIIYIADGVGVWKLRPADISMSSNSRPPVTSLSIGIEQLVVNWIQSRPSNLPVQVICMDRAVFVLEDQTKYPPTCKTQAIVNAYGKDINEGYSIDYASSDPTFSIALVGHDFTPYGTFYLVKSSDGGATWTQTPSNPTGITASGGCVAALTPTNWIWVENNGWNAASNVGGRVYYTQNGGTTWAQITTPGLAPGDGFYGPNSNYSLRRQIAVADRVNGNFYLYNSGTVAPGIWRSTDGGVNFARVCTSRLDGGTAQDAWNCQFRPLPPYPGYTGGEMYATGGTEDPGNPGSALYECKDIGASVTMTVVPGTSFVWAVGIGKAKPAGSGYPAIFIYGIIDAMHDSAGIGGQGVWRSDDHCAHWTLLTIDKFVNHSMDAIGTVEGDMNVYGKCYVGFAGSGMMTYTP